MCVYCSQAGRWLRNCLDGGSPSPPRAVELSVTRTSRASSYAQPYPVHQPMSASSSGHYYPGSTFAATAPGSRASTSSSQRTSATGISVASAQHALHAIESSRSLESLARQVSGDVRDLRETIEDLRDMHRRVDPASYAKREPWTDAMLRAYDRYKALGQQHAAAQRAFYSYINTHGKKNGTTEEHVDRARLGIKWGQAAVDAGEARLDFMASYRDAYQLQGFEGHLNAANNALVSARAGVREARRNYDAIWVSLSRPVDTTVFQ